MIKVDSRHDHWGGSRASGGSCEAWRVDARGVAGQEEVIAVSCGFRRNGHGILWFNVGKCMQKSFQGWNWSARFGLTRVGAMIGGSFLDQAGFLGRRSSTARADLEGRSPGAPVSLVACKVLLVRR